MLKKYKTITMSNMYVLSFTISKFFSHANCTYVFESMFLKRNQTVKLVEP
jgi:hypothetical protein